MPWVPFAFPQETIQRIQSQVDDNETRLQSVDRNQVEGIRYPTIPPPTLGMENPQMLHVWCIQYLPYVWGGMFKG